MVGAATFAYVDLRQGQRELELQYRQLRSAPGSSTVEPVAAGADDEPVVETGDWTCSGAIPAAVVQHTLGRLGPQIFDCYYTRQSEEPALRGLFTVDLRVGLDGRVASSKTSSSIEDAGFLDCAIQAVHRWEFPRPVGGDCAVVSIPFDLAPRAVAHNSKGAGV
jgi:hypothetical protein